MSSALAAIHQAGIVHRDLTPQNLLRMADGRVVLTDFGLATDTRDGASSVAGGTVSYMAPELLRGGRSSVGSDLWALGIVMHEIVFGEKPRWGEGTAPEMLAPELGPEADGRRRDRLEACRACTVHDPAQRLQCPVEAGRRLTERVGRRRRRLSVPKRVALVAGLVLAMVGGAAAIAVSMVRPAGRRPRTRRASGAAIVADRAGGRGRRLDADVGGAGRGPGADSLHAPAPRSAHDPVRVGDADARRGHRHGDARAQPVACRRRRYRGGCPDVSPDGKRLVYQGRAPDGRAFAFVSQHPDGRDAVPVVQTAEPSMASEPTWLADGDTFSYDVDAKHMAVFSTTPAG